MNTNCPSQYDYTKKRMNKMYIYKTTNLTNGKFYIGKSTREINESAEYYGSGKILKLAIEKYGKDNFTKEIIDIADTLDELNTKEINWINTLDAKNRTKAYNIADGGSGGYTGGRHTDTIIRMNTIGADGLTEFQRNNKKGIETGLKNDSYKKGVVKAIITKNKQIDENGLNGHQRAIHKGNNTLKQRINTDGVDGMTLKLQKTNETKLNDVDENGLNGHQRGTLKSLETRRKNAKRFNIYRKGKLIYSRLTTVEVTRLNQGLLSSTSEKPLGFSNVSKSRLNRYNNLHLIGLYIELL